MALFPRVAQKMVLIVRVDLNMSPGKIASQCAHAALECYLKSNRGIFNSIRTKSWILSGQPKIVLKVHSERQLKSLAGEAIAAGLNVVTIRDAGRTQIESGTITVLGIGPNNAEQIDGVTSYLKLL